MKSKNSKIQDAEIHPILSKCFSTVRSAAMNASVYLQQKTEPLTALSKRIWLFIFCIAGAAGSVSVIAYSFVSVNPPFQTHSIRLPAHLLKIEHATVGDSLITVSQYGRMRQFEQYLQRQREDVSGKLFYDSFLKARPHLIDSLRMIDSIFLSQ